MLILFCYLQIDLQETKEKEITKLQNVLQEIQGKLAEAHNQIIHEKEAEKLAINKPLQSSKKYQL